MRTKTEDAEQQRCLASVCYSTYMSACCFSFSFFLVLFSDFPPKVNDTVMIDVGNVTPCYKIRD